MADRKQKRKGKARLGSLRWFTENWNRALGPRANPKLGAAIAKLCVENHRLAKHVRYLEEAIGEVEADMASKLHHMGHAIVAINDRQQSLHSLVAVSPLQISDAKRWLANDGMVKIEGAPHLRECQRVTEPGSPSCTCGSVPSRRPN